MMRGQKKYGKRSVEGSLTIDGVDLTWQLISEPQAIAGTGLRGMRISVRAEHGHNRELILDYPFPKKAVDSRGLAHFPQRPKFSPKTIEAGIRQALAGGWDPASRGKAFTFGIPEFSS